MTDLRELGRQWSKMQGAVAEIDPLEFIDIKMVGHSSFDPLSNEDQRSGILSITKVDTEKFARALHAATFRPGVVVLSPNDDLRQKVEALEADLRRVKDESRQRVARLTLEVEQLKAAKTADPNHPWAPYPAQATERRKTWYRRMLRGDWGR